jgi:hypothetical protein
MGSSACGRVETDFRLTVAAMVSANGGPARGNASATGWFATGRGPYSHRDKTGGGRGERPHAITIQILVAIVDGDGGSTTRRSSEVA